MIKLILINLFWLWVAISVFVSAIFPKNPVPVPIQSPIVRPTPSPSVIPTLTPTPGPSPAGDDGEEWLAFLGLWSDRDQWNETNYDPVQTRNGTDIRVKDIIVQSVAANAAVRLTCGYNNIFYNDGSGDIRGLAFQGYINIEQTLPVAKAFSIFDLFISSAWAKQTSDKWKEVKAIKKLEKLQTKKKPKKEKWKVDNGLKKKKEKFDNE